MSLKHHKQEEGGKVYRATNITKTCEGTVRVLQGTESGVKMSIGHIDMKLFNR
jgi:hypothetical protein